MKKFFALLLAALTLLTVTSCGGKGGDKASTATAQEVYDAIDKAFAEKYPEAGAAIPMMPMPVDETVLKEKFGMTDEIAEDYAGNMAGVMTNCDILLVVKVKEGKMEEAKAALEKAKSDQEAQFEFYPVMGNDLRLAAAKVVENANFAALLMVGILPEDGEVTDFAPDVEMAEKAFNEAVDAGKK